MPITATALRADVYRILDQVLASGEPIEVTRGNRTLKIVPDEPATSTRLGRVRTRPEALLVDPESIVHLDWSGEWRP